MMSQWLEEVWYGQSLWSKVLTPLSWLYRGLFHLDKKRAIPQRPSFPVPIIVVGNITVGGTGKTPLTLAILAYCKSQGYRPGVVSRGYGGQPPSLPHRVDCDDRAEQVGDEPLLIRRRSDCPVVVDPDRCRAVSCLLENYSVDLVVSDDGLQHHRLPRDIEIIVIDGNRRLGNGQCLPAGPLRESKARLATVDFVVSNGKADNLAEHTMLLEPRGFFRVGDGQETAVNAFRGEHVDAVAGIGNPDRFFRQLAKLGVKAVTHPFPDHHSFTPEDLQFDPQRTILMTEKDAAKCHHFGLADAWYLRIDAELEVPFWSMLLEKIDIVLARKQHG